MGRSSEMQSFRSGLNEVATALEVLSKVLLLFGRKAVGYQVRTPFVRSRIGRAGQFNLLCAGSRGRAESGRLLTGKRSMR